MVKLRLQRHGKKGKPFFKLVAVNSKDKRDGRFIELIGTYNPNTNPSEINIELDRAVYWLEVGAQPSETAERILSYKGALLKKHLNGGVKKGALTQEQADAKFNKWLEEKEAKVSSKKDKISKDASKQKESDIEKEKATNRKRSEAIAAKNTPAPKQEEVREEPASEVEPQSAE